MLSYFYWIPLMCSFFIPFYSDAFDDFPVPLPSGVIDVEMSGKASREAFVGVAHEPTTEENTETYCTPMEGRPWVCIGTEDSSEAEHGDHTGCSVSYVPSINNVEQIVLKVWAKSYTGFCCFLRMPTCSVSVKIKFKLSPHGQGMREIIDKCVLDEAEKRAIMQLDEFNLIEQNCKRIESDARLCLYKEFESISNAYDEQRMTGPRSAQMFIDCHAGNYQPIFDYVVKKLMTFANKWQNPKKEDKDAVQQRGVWYVDRQTVLKLRKTAKQFIALEKQVIEKLNSKLEQLIQADAFNDPLLKEVIELKILGDQTQFAGREAGELYGPLEFIIMSYGHDAYFKGLEASSSK